MNNSGLKKLYDIIYKDGSKKFFTFSNINEAKLIMSFMPTWEGLDVLEIGCGEGRLATALATIEGANVWAIDYSEEAISIAGLSDNPRFKCVDYQDINRTFDVVVMQGVLEHMDEPFVTLKHILDNNVRTGGTLITSSPSFLNPRGYVWMTLNLLFNVPMTLSDLHFLCPFDFEEFCGVHDLKLEIKSTDHDWGSGDRLITDFEKRLPDTLRRAGMDDSKVERLLVWLERAGSYFNHDEYSGVNVAYKITK